MNSIHAHKKVIGFDNWVGGAHHFERLVQAFADNGLDLTLLHLGSWGNDVGRPQEEVVGRLRVRDISWYGRASFPEILDREKPDAVLFLSIDTFSHRAFNRECRAAGVPTIYLYNGVVGVQPSHLAKRWKVRFLPQLLFALGKIPKAMRHVWPCYAASLWRSGATVSEWVRFASDVALGAAGRIDPVGADDARTDRCCVLAPMDAASTIARYRYADDQVTAVGLSDLINFGVASGSIAWHLDHPSSDRNDIMYIDTGFLAAGGVYASSQDFVDHMVKTGEYLRSKGANLVFKPHPDHIRSGLVDVIRSKGVNICDRTEFVERLLRCRAVIVEASSAALVPAVLGLPMLLARYDALSNELYGEILTSYPRARLLTDLAAFDDLLRREAQEFDMKRVRRWISDNVGPLPVEDIPRRVAQVVSDVISERNTETGHSGQRAG